jgi:glycosyltransferase involved in cell wall biosynthesis
LKILAIYPGLNPVYDEVAYALPPLLARGCEVRVVTTRTSALKSTELAAEFENFRGVGISRIYDNLPQLVAHPETRLPQVLALLEEFSPDLLLVNSFHCLPLLKLLRQRSDIPAVLRVESADPLILLRRRYYLGIPALGRIAGRARWRQVAGQVEALMTNDPSDLPQLGSFDTRGRSTYYAGHCAQRPDDLALAAQRDRGEMIYIGSMIRHKNCDVWLKTVPALFDNTPVERFTVIGRGPYLPVVEQLKKRFGKRITHIPGVTRREAMERLSGAHFAYTESSSGWGFLCDAWSTGTPLLCPQSNFCIVPGWTGMMPRTPQALISNVRRLYDDADYYRTLQQGGAIRYAAEHTADVVSQQYLQVFRDVVALHGVAPAR